MKINYIGCWIWHSGKMKVGQGRTIQRKTSMFYALSEQKKNINNVCVTNSGIALTQDTIPVIETMEILQNYKSIEDVNKSALAAYMREFALEYSDTAVVFVLKNRKYKKSSIAFLERFLNYFGVENTLDQFLSALSSYDIPEMEEFYESTRA